MQMKFKLAVVAAAVALAACGKRKKQRPPHRLLWSTPWL